MANENSSKDANNQSSLIGLSTAGEVRNVRLTDAGYLIVSGSTGGGGSAVDTELPTAAALSDTMANPTTPLVGAAGVIWDEIGSQWVRVHGARGDGGAVTNAAVPPAALVTRTGASTWTPIRSATDGLSATNVLAVTGELHNGATLEMPRSASAANQSAATKTGVGVVARPGEWTALHVPATATQATISKAAGAAGVRHICTSITATLAAGASALAAGAPLTVNLRDGATGAGTVLWTSIINIPANAAESNTITISGLSIVGTAATAMTLEFAAAGGTNSYQSVSMTGYSV